MKTDEYSLIPRAAMRKRLKAYALVAALATCGLLAGLYANGATVRSNLAAKMEAVRQCRAVVHSAVEHRTFVADFWDHYPVTTWHWERDFAAEREAGYDTAHGDRIERMVDDVDLVRQHARNVDIADAASRVLVAIRHYDAAVADYNGYAGSLRLVRAYPLHVPYSREVSRW